MLLNKPSDHILSDNSHILDQFSPTIDSKEILNTPSNQQELTKEEIQIDDSSSISTVQTVANRSRPQTARIIRGGLSAGEMTQQNGSTWGEDEQNADNGNSKFRIVVRHVRTGGFSRPSSAISAI